MHLPCFQVTNIFPNEFLADKHSLGVLFFIPCIPLQFTLCDLERDNAKIFVQQSNFYTTFPNKTTDWMETLTFYSVCLATAKIVLRAYQGG